MSKPIVTLTPQVRQQQRQLASKVALLKNELMNAGLVLTAQTLEPVIRKIGWEIAALEEWDMAASAPRPRHDS
jgi:hypothetical protein